MNCWRNAAQRSSVTDWVLDASALLAVVNRERGWEAVVRQLPRSFLCTVNLSEVVAKLLERGAELEATRRHLAAYELRIVPFDEEIAYIASSLRPATRSHGLSLGDRACLALGIAKRVPIVTAEREWKHLTLGLKIEVIR